MSLYVNSPQSFDGDRSAIIADPQLQLAKKSQLRKMASEVREVSKVEDKFMTAEKEFALSAILAAASIAFVALGLYAALSLGATGVGASVALIGLLAVGYSSVSLFASAYKKQQNEKKYLGINADAEDYRLTQTVELSDFERKNAQQGGQSNRPFIPQPIGSGRGQSQPRTNSWLS